MRVRVSEHCSTCTAAFEPLLVTAPVHEHIRIQTEVLTDLSENQVRSHGIALTTNIFQWINESCKKTFVPQTDAERCHHFIPGDNQTLKHERCMNMK